MDNKRKREVKGFVECDKECSDSAQLEPRPEFQFDDFQLLQPVSVDDLADIFCGDTEAEEWFGNRSQKDT